MEHLIAKFTPLFKSISRYFCSYDGILDQPFDTEDLYSQIQLEFIKLVRHYDPHRGVDLPGYIKLNLQNRVYYWVIKHQRLKGTEKLMTISEEDEDLDLGADLDYIAQYHDIIDTSIDKEKYRIEALMSLPWDKLEDESDRDMVIDILNHVSLEEIARKRHTVIASVTQQFNRICDLLIESYNERSESSEKNSN